MIRATKCTLCRLTLAMETIGKQKLWSFLDQRGKAKETKCSIVRQNEAQRVTSYMELASKVAELQFLNRRFCFDENRRVKGAVGCRRDKLP